MRRVVFATVLLAATAAWSADDFAYARRLYLDKAQCQYCHGWAGDGAGDGQAGAAPSLRATKLNRAQIVDVILCGRPGTPMPRFDEAAYSDKRCYGMTEADLGSRTPPLPPGSPLQRREAEAIADYLVARFVGRGKVTLEDCEEAFGRASRACVQYGAKP